MFNLLEFALNFFHHFLFSFLILLLFRHFVCDILSVIISLLTNAMYHVICR